MLDGLAIRPWRAEDAGPLSAARPPEEAQDPILAPDSFRPDHGRLAGGQVWLRALTATVDGEPAGAGAVWASRWHPGRLWAFVEVTPIRRRQGVGTALVAALRQLAQRDGRPLRAKVRPGEPSAALAAATGFGTVLITSTERELDPALLPEPSSRVQPADVGSAELARLFRRLYVAVHPTDPPGGITDEDVRRTHLGEAAGAVIARTDWGAPLAVALLFDEGRRWGFSGGSFHPGDPGSVGTVSDLVLGAARLVPAGARLVLEVDDAMADVAAAADGLGAAYGDVIRVVAEG